ncbi:hypothetical protein Poli38472_014307 [Pythium oligandrum]|uniref:DNA excision repair protein ERCC-6 n=1 Tax=Pythium oligandrum TaxID=41045 RepID=A0A8K1FE86_PYTOL|nr:hypothetical protein Poli38472_014307 [Pythium oligandrum]|eukprot:TMW57704.1 hypothetical protein Poli38472_014307 [Pythium oligandrum]
MTERGSLRSETRAAALALRGQQRVGEQLQETPPSSPPSAAMLAAFGLDVDEEGKDDDDEWQEDAKRALSDSDDSDFQPNGSKKTKKKRRLRLKQSPSGKAKLQKTMVKKEGEEVKPDASMLDVEGTKFRSSTRGRGEQNWVDDGCVASYEKRIHEFRYQVRQSIRDDMETFYNKPKPDREETLGASDDLDDGGFNDEGDASIQSVDAEQSVTEDETWYSPDDVLVMDSGLAVPTYIHAHLYPHQKECLDWLHHLHERNTGGILGDEMGLGKTVQIASFLGAMYHSRRIRTVLLLCPASVLLQWVREFHKWYPLVRVVLLHASGTGVTRASRTYTQLIDEVTQFGDGDEQGGGVIISTYENVRQYQELFLDFEWDYVVLDEGHRIRNPDAEITLVCKQLRTVHRIILTGTPIQNRLRELWSLFDFVYPGKLGTLPTFEDEFVLPIRTGGYSNASKMQVVMAYKCALALKDIINPFMLRRTKKEIQHVTKMPEKMEQIIFCNLTSRQYETYESFLSSPEVAAVLRQDIRPFRAISILRHICNHPDLLSTVGEFGVSGFPMPKRSPDEPYGSVEASGKMMVLQKILGLWKQQGHRVLLFTQTRKMLDILESFMASLGYIYCRLDGTTSVKERQTLLDAFNQDGSQIFIFLLTTRAGGIGVNLTGADRVVIFDPDWNPSTDLQARERSWRLGQTKQVTIYRLITSGTIEEKIYHRQIFKQYLTTKVLHDAKRKRCFNKHTLRDLFILGDQRVDGNVETTELLVEGNVERPGAELDADSIEEGEVEDGAAIIEDDKETDETVGSPTSGGNDNDAILKHLFEGENVKGVFNHDVVESDGVQNQEADLIELESSKIAQSALSALQASCAMVRQQRRSQFTPTWTGRSGEAGDPNQRAPNRFGNRVARGRQNGAVANSGRPANGNPFAQSTVSSREMLSRIKNRKSGVATAAARAPAPHLQADGFMSVDEMTKQLHAFLVSRSNSGQRHRGATTEELLDAFANLVAPKDKLVFRKLLRDMAVCRDRRWELKPEYKTEPV